MISIMKIKELKAQSYHVNIFYVPSFCLVMPIGHQEDIETYKEHRLPFGKQKGIHKHASVNIYIRKSIKKQLKSQIRYILPGNRGSHSSKSFLVYTTRHNLKMAKFPFRLLFRKNVYFCSDTYISIYLCDISISFPDCTIP